MKMSRCCAIALCAAIAFAGIALWQFYKHIDQGINLTYARTVSDERAQVIEQLRSLALDELKGANREQVMQLLSAKGIDWFAKEHENLLVGGSLAFAFEGDRLIDIRSIYGEVE